MNIKKLSSVKIIVIVLLIISVIVFGSLSWFTMSKEVEGSGTQMTASDLPFEIATTGSKGIRYQDLLATLSSSNKVGNEDEISETIFYKTSGETDKIMLRYDTGGSEIGPGGRGALSLYLIPKDNGNVKAKITIDVKSYAYYDIYDLDTDGNKIQKTDENDVPLWEDENKIIPVYQTTQKLLNVDKVTEAMCTLSADEIAAIQQSAQYLKGHIMFFGGLSTDETKYYFTTPYTNWSFEFEQKNAVKWQAYQIPLYWMWSNTLGQIVLKTENVQRNGIPLVRDLTTDEIEDIPNENLTDKEKVIQYVKDNKNLVLKNWESILTDSEELTAVPKLMASESVTQEKAKSMVVDGIIDNADNADNFKRLRNCIKIACTNCRVMI
ncbi:MAG: hypothetical protein VZR53_08440 [Prevotella sp.]|nr:hypothetical protein [Prevotella sp.]